MRQKIIYILLMITTAMSWSLEVKAQRNGYQYVTDFDGTTTFSGKTNTGTGLGQVSNGVFSALQNHVTFSMSNINSTSDGTIFLGRIEDYPSTRTSDLSWNAENGFMVGITKVEIGIRAYQPATSTKTANAFLSCGDINGESVDCKTNNTSDTKDIKNISIQGNLSTSITLNTKTTTRPTAVGVGVWTEFRIRSISFTYKVYHEEEIIHTITISNGTATTTTAGIDTQGTATANDPQEGYEFLGWNIPNEVTLVSGYTATDKTIKFNASADATVTAKYGKIYDVTIVNNVDATTTNVEAGNKTIGIYTAADKVNYEFFEWSVPTNITLTSGTTKIDKSISFNAFADNLTITAYYKPVFNFSASATSSNETLGTATATVSNTKILGDVEATQESTTATFTATPANDCVFKGWYETSTYEGNPVSTDLTYDVNLTNSTIGSTVSKTLYALFKKKQNLQWADANLDLNLVNGQTYPTGGATVTSGKTIAYTSDNHNAVTIDADGTIHAVGLGDAHVTASVPGDETYDAETITRDFAVGEIKQATFTPAWGEGTSTDIKVDGSTSVALTNIANDETFTISASEDGIVTWSREGNTLNIAAVSAGTTTLTISQEGNTSLAGNQVTYTITVSKYPNTFALADETKAMKVDEVWENVVTDHGNGNTTVSYSVEDVATYDAETNKITALAEGSTVITFVQEATAINEGTSKSINVTVTKVVNTLSVTLGNTEVDVDGTINLIVAGRVSDGATHAYISDMQLSSEVNNGTDVITYASDVITACNAGTAKIKFTQDATNKYTSYESETYTITVNKLSNAITVTLDGEQKNSKNVGRGATVAMNLASTSGSDDFQFSRISGTDDIATINTTSIVSGQTDGTSIWEISQPETYKYVAATTTVRVKVNSEPEEEGYVLNEEREYSQGTGEGVTHTYTLSGPGETLTYSARTQSAAIYYHLYVQYSTDGSNWINAQDNQQLGSSYQNYSCDIPEEAKYVRFYFPAGGTLTKYVKNVKVTRKTYVRATATQTNLGEVYTDKTVSTTFNVSYSSTNGGNIEILSNNPRFSVDQADIPVQNVKKRNARDLLNETESITVTNHSDNVGTPVVITVTYTPDSGHLGDDEGTITISDRYYSAELTFTAFAKKYPTTISRGSNTATETTVDGSIDNAFAFTGTSATAPTANSDDDFYYTIASTYTSEVHTEDGVITYDPATNTITGRNAGTARLTIYQKSTDLYAATSQTFDFAVSKLANPVNIALSTTSIEVDGAATIALTNDDGKGVVSVAYSNIVYANEALNREGGLLSYNEETKTFTGVNAGTATVTVTQAETYKYVAKSQQFVVTVNKLTQTLEWDHEVETTLQVGTVIDNNTATSIAGLTPVTYTSSNTAAIEVDAESGKLTAKAVGANITITASQAGNYKYAPATITRQFSVFNKQTPTFIPDEAHYNSNTKTITVDWEGAATITVTGVGANAEAGFMITNGSDAVISVERNESTITIHGLTIGNTTLTLAQTANDDFIAKSETYTINVVMPSDYIILDPTVAPTIAEGTYRKVTLNRTLKAGYSTIALPFEVDATTLSANAWVAQLSIVTYNAHDGYSLYFKKSNMIKANEPYILHLDAEVVSPVFRGTIAVSEATPKDHTADKGVNADGHSFTDWTMHSNYTPGFDMEGRFGVVNNLIMKGGSGSTLSAFTAYITGPDNKPAKVKAAYLDDKEVDGILELLQNQGNEETQIYDLQGRQLPEAQRGVNIVRQTDGSVRKIMKR